MKCWQGGREIGALILCWWECKIVPPLWKTILHFLIKLNKSLTDYPEIAFLGIYHREMETGIHVKISTQMFIADLFIFKTGNNVMLFSRWINQLWYPYHSLWYGYHLYSAMEYNSVIKKYDLLIYVTIYMDFQGIVLNKNFEFQNVMYYMALFM